VKCFATIRHSKTDPNVAVVATILNMVPTTADPIGDLDCACGDGFMFFAFCFFIGICRSCWVRSFDLTRDAPRRFFPIVGRMIARRATEVLKADGKRRMTSGDGL
jgi:hypothetical protein